MKISEWGRKAGVAHLLKHGRDAVSDDDPVFAELLYAFSNLSTIAESVLFEEVCGILGFEEYEQVKFDDVTHDYYDSSFELKGAHDDLRITDEQWDKFRELGFSRAWICHKDGTETVYPGGHRKEAH